MSNSKKADQIIPGLDIDGRLSLEPDMLSLLVTQMRHSEEKKNKAQNVKLRRAARDQFEKSLSAHSKLLDKAQDQLASCTQDYLANHTKELDKIRGLWTAIAQRREALMELILSEEEAANQRELDREKDSVAYLSQARADIEEQRRIQSALNH